MKYIAAIYMHGGKVVTGMNHGDAFGKMTVEEQDSLFTSGFLDPKTGEFVADEESFYVKELILIRHSEIKDETSHTNPHTGQPDPELSDEGRFKASTTIESLSEKLDLSGYAQFTGFARRCQETARIFDEHTHLGVEYLPWLEDFTEEESVSQFVGRLKIALDRLPQKSLVVSHCNCILNLAQLALGLHDISMCPQWNGVIPKCSVTYLNGKEAVWIGHELTHRA
jgi:broad specificity phosphatase PhoE